MEPTIDLAAARAATLKIYQSMRESAMGYALVANANLTMGRHAVGMNAVRLAADAADEAAQMHHALWPADSDPFALCRAPDPLELFQGLVAALAYCDVLTDAPEKAPILEWMAPLIERAQTWLGDARMHLGLASIPKTGG